MDQVHDVTRSVVSAHLRSLQCPEANSVLLAYQAGDTGAISRVQVDPSECFLDTADSFYRKWQAVSLLEKARFLPSSGDLKQKAIDKWRVTEEVCNVINQCGRYSSDLGLSQSEEAISLARKYIKDALGRFSWNDVHARSRFSSGASTSGKRRVGHPYHKYQRKLDVTPDCFELASAAVRADQQWLYATVLTHGPCPKDWFRLTLGSKMDTVPKNSRIDRVICIEPDMNMYLQKGIGSVIRACLKRVGVNLNSQALNQLYAWIGSRTGSLATIDLSSASDSLALELIRDLLPPDWFKALYMTRSHYTKIGEEWVPLEKISSMGNGYTFELESLIFWALAKASVTLTSCDDRRLAIYGDDIVCHHDALPVLLPLLSYVGFTINDEKSFISGPFRESCGRHYFYGTDVTPFRIVEPLNNLGQLYWYANSLYQRMDAKLFVDDNLEKYVSSKLPDRWRMRVPRSFGLKAGLWNKHMIRRSHRYCRHLQAPKIRYLSYSRTPHDPSGWAGLHYVIGYDASTESPFGVHREQTTARVKRAVVSSWE